LLRHPPTEHEAADAQILWDAQVAVTPHVVSQQLNAPVERRT
jgi:hypothetical protein